MGNKNHYVNRPDKEGFWVLTIMEGENTISNFLVRLRKYKEQLIVYGTMIYIGESIEENTFLGYTLEDIERHGNKYSLAYQWLFVQLISKDIVVDKVWQKVYGEKNE